MWFLCSVFWTLIFLISPQATPLRLSNQSWTSGTEILRSSLQSGSGLNKYLIQHRHWFTNPLNKSCKRIVCLPVGISSAESLAGMLDCFWSLGSWMFAVNFQTAEFVVAVAVVRGNWWTAVAGPAVAAVVVTVADFGTGPADFWTVMGWRMC